MTKNKNEIITPEEERKQIMQETPEVITKKDFKKKMKNVNKLTDKQLLSAKIKALSGLDSLKDEIEFCDGELSQKVMLQAYLFAIEATMNKRGLRKK